MPTREDQSKGGEARAKRLSSEERRAIASAAAQARWERESQSILPKETHAGVIQAGGRSIPCSVLDNGMRVFSGRGLYSAMGASRRGDKRDPEPGGARLPSFLDAKSVKDFIPNDLMVALISPIQYRPKSGGGVAFGYEATLLPKICEAILDARKASKLRTKQLPMADTAEMLIRGFARVGVIALVDEATGYQEERAKDELAKILEAYVAPELMPWTRKFPPEFFRQVYRIHGWSYQPGSAKRTPYVGKLINKYIYDQLPPGVLEELRRRNPITDNGHRKHKHYRFLTGETGIPHLDKQVAAVTMLMRVSDSTRDFEYNFERAFSGIYQERLPLVIEGDSEKPSK